MKNVLVILLCFIGFKSYSQTTSFYTNDWTGSSQWRYNPALQSHEKFYLYLPGFSGFQYGLGHTGFSYSDAVTDNSVNVSSLVDGLENENHFLTQLDADIFAFGVKAGKVQLRGGARMNLETRLTYSKDMLELIWKGNGHPDVIGRRMSMNGTGVNAQSYLNYFIGGSIEAIPNQLSVGLNVNFYNGIGSIKTERSVFGLTTDRDDYTITADGSFSLLSSGGTLYTDLDSLEVSRFSPLSVEGNKGFGVDLGLVYQPSEKFQVEAAVLNLGQISWTEDIQNYELQDTEISYSGFELGDLINGTDSVDVITQFTDSITDAFVPDENLNEFKSGVNGEFLVRGIFHLSDKDDVSLLLSNKNSFGHNFQSIVGYYSREFGTSLKLGGGLHLFNNSSLLVPIGLVFNAGPFQLGLQTENILSVTNWKNAKYASASFSLGLRFGKEKGEIFEKSKEAKRKAKKEAKKKD